MACFTGRAVELLLVSTKDNKFLSSYFSPQATTIFNHHMLGQMMRHFYTTVNDYEHSMKILLSQLRTLPVYSAAISFSPPVRCSIVPLLPRYGLPGHVRFPPVPVYGLPALLASPQPLRRAPLQPVAAPVGLSSPPAPVRGGMHIYITKLKFWMTAKHSEQRSSMKSFPEVRDLQTGTCFPQRTLLLYLIHLYKWDSLIYFSTSCTNGWKGPHVDWRPQFGCLIYIIKLLNWGQG